MVMNCDFCNALNPTKRYSCESFSFTIAVGNRSVTQDTTGDWMACETCASMVDKADWEALAERALLSYSPEEREIFRGFVHEFQRQFQIHRKETK